MSHKLELCAGEDNQQGGFRPLWRRKEQGRTPKLCIANRGWCYSLCSKRCGEQLKKERCWGKPCYGSNAGQPTDNYIVGLPWSELNMRAQHERIRPPYVWQEILQTMWGYEWFSSQSIYQRIRGISSLPFMTDIENIIGANLEERKWDGLNEDIWRI